MKKKRILITGGSGLLGLNWACLLRETWDVVLGTHRQEVCLSGVTTVPLALTNTELLTRQLAAMAPDVIIHAAGMTSVDECEIRHEEAKRVNVELSEYIATAAAVLGIELVHISTDHLFQGQHSFIVESEPVSPLNYYGFTKAMAEERVQAVNPSALIIRTNFFGWGHVNRQSFSDWLIYNLRAGVPLTVFDDVFFTPILAESLAITVHKLLEKKSAGVFNVVGDERISKYEFAVKLSQHFALPEKLIRRNQIVRAELLAARPRDMSLSNKKVQMVLGGGLGAIDDFFIALRQQESNGRRVELYGAVRKDMKRTIS